MGRRRRNRSGLDAETIARMALFVIALGALTIGGVQGFGEALTRLVCMILIAAFGLGLLALTVAVGIRIYRHSKTRAAATEFAADGVQGSVFKPNDPSLRLASTGADDSGGKTVRVWQAEKIRTALGQIDWYQFEKFCAALLEADGFAVTRSGGARPDGGVDLLVEKSGARALIQCKHWRTWDVKEATVREMLGSMTHFKVGQGAIYTLKGWTRPAAQLAAQHQITLVNGDELAQSAAFQLSQSQLDELLRTDVHHCPKCESTMVERSGTFGRFWGCSCYPACRGKLKHHGVR